MNLLCKPTPDASLVVCGTYFESVSIIRSVGSQMQAIPPGRNFPLQEYSSRAHLPTGKYPNPEWHQGLHIMLIHSTNHDFPTFLSLCLVVVFPILASYLSPLLSVGLQKLVGLFVVDSVARKTLTGELFQSSRW